MKKNAFTLIELLVAISIMSIVMVLAIPSIGAIQERNNIRRYKNYGESLVSSGKLYTDSNSIDMFGYEKDGCFDIYFEKLVEKKLAKDIDYKDVTCADNTTKRTFVRVKKLDGELKYQLSMYCVDGKGNKTYSDLMKDKEPICAGEKSYLGPEIIVSPGKTNGYSNDENYKVSITVKDDDGLLENNEVEYAWCTKSDCSDVTSYTRLKFENKRDVKKASRKIKRPKEDGEYYFIVRPVVVVDVFNNATNESVVTGPYKFDITPPTVTVRAYKRDGSGNNSGTYIAQRTVNVSHLSDKIDSYPNNYNGWLNLANYPYGVNYEITYSDNLMTNSLIWSENTANLTSSNSKVNTLKSKTIALNQKSGVNVQKLVTEGYRVAKIKVTDMANNFVMVDLSAALDRTAPTRPGISNPTSGNWTNKNFRLTLTSSDAISGLLRYEYKYSTTNWTSYSNSNKTSFTTPDIANEMNDSIHVRAIDNAGNNSQEQTSTIKLDKTPPKCESSGGRNSWTGANTAQKITGKCTDSLSGCVNSIVEQTFSTDKNAQVSPGTVYDNAGNSTKCDNQQVMIDISPPTCNVTGESTKWGNTNVTLVGTCNDTSSGCVKKTIQQTYTAEGNRKETPGSVSDNAGNTTPCESKSVMIDKTGPGCNVTGASADWGKTDVTLVGTCSDSLSGCTKTSIQKTFSAEGNRNETPGDLYDNAGNKTTCESKSVMIDKTGPECNVTGASTGWGNSNVTLVGTCSDSLSGCASPSVQQTFTKEGNRNETPGDLYDKVGNKTTCEKKSVMIDKTKPTCTVTKSDNDKDSGITIKVECSDDASGVNNCWTSSTANSVTHKNITYTMKYDSDSSKNYMKKYRVTDKAGNSKQCAQVTVHKQKDTWNSCKTGSNTCKYGCDTCTSKTKLNSRKEAENCTATGGSVHTASGFGECWKDYDCNCDNCYSGSNTCKGDWNNSWTNDSNCSAVTKSVRCRYHY